MPLPQHPPTPISSTELKSKDGSQFSTLQISFELPPPATSQASPTLPASEVVKCRRRSSNATQTAIKDAFALPPPPTRSRKIIQMTPQAPAEEVAESNGGVKKSASKSTAPPKKKQPSTSMAGRKIARKTAHSLIERRRRSKMNEEFGALKNLIPACTGEMHKLAILQASIDYIKYLEDCVAQLKIENTRSNSASASKQFSLPPLPSGQPPDYTELAEDDEDDVDMETTPNDASSQNKPRLHSQPASVSPTPMAYNGHRRQSSYSSTSGDSRYYPETTSNNTSPVLGPGAYGHARSTASLTNLASSRDSDHEATAALLMLNRDRRGTLKGDGGRGMSVNDLLST